MKPGESLWWVNGEDATSGAAPAKIRMWKTLSKEEKQELVAQVAMLTPENIHLNSFMFEPILDMSLLHLYDLYQEVKNLLI